MRVASYNIRKAVGLDWRRRPDRIMAVLAEIDADVVTLQEADRRLGGRAGVLNAEALAQELGYQVAPVSVRAASHGWHGNVILSRLPWDNCVRVPIPVGEPRGAVAATLESNGLTVVGAHLGLSPGIRAQQMAALGRFAAECAGPVVIAGDLNSRKMDAWVAAQLGQGLQVAAPGPSYHTKRPTACLDRFAYGAGVVLRACFVHVSSQARKGSDHLPVVMDFDVVARL